MTTQEKMQKVISSVLTDNSYEVTLIGDNSFQVVSPWETWFRESVHDIKSHWREEVRKVINIIVDKKINKALNEV